MRRYEMFTILDPDLAEEDRKPVLDRIHDEITKQDGLMVEVDVWGNRNLAYEIKKKSRGFYVRYDYCGTGALVDELERFFRIDDRVMKYMTVLLEKDADVDAIKAELEQAAEKETAEPAPAEPAPAEPTPAEPTPTEPAEAVQSDPVSPETPDVKPAAETEASTPQPEVTEPKEEA